MIQRVLAAAPNAVVTSACKLDIRLADGPTPSVQAVAFIRGTCPCGECKEWRGGESSVDAERGD